MQDKILYVCITDTCIDGTYNNTVIHAHNTGIIREFIAQI